MGVFLIWDKIQAELKIKMLASLYQLQFMKVAGSV